MTPLIEHLFSLRKDLFIMKKLLFVFLSVVTFFCLTAPVSANTTDSSLDIPTEVQAVFDELALVTEYDEQGFPYLNLDQAYKLGLSEDSIAVALDVNSMVQELKNDGFNNGTVQLRQSLYDRLTRYGHYCGGGNLGWDVAPIDNLDWACRRHDLCWQGWGSESKECNRQFIAELKAIIANHPGTPRANYAFRAIIIFTPFS